MTVYGEQPHIEREANGGKGRMLSMDKEIEMEAERKNGGRKTKTNEFQTTASAIHEMKRT